MKDPKGGFARAYTEFYNDYYKPRVEDKRAQQPEGTTTYTSYKGPELRQVVTALMAGEEHGKCKYSASGETGKGGWKDVDHCARLLHVASEWHMKRSAGLWYQNRVPIDEIYQKIWQMYLRENHLRAPTRKSKRLKTSESFKSTERVEEDDDEKEGGTDNSDDEETKVISTTNGGMRINCDAIRNGKDSFTLANVADMTYAQVHESILMNLDLKSEKLRVIALSRESDETEITEINFGEYQHELLTKVKKYDSVSLETAAAYQVEGVGDIAGIGELEGRIVNPYDIMLAKERDKVFNMKDQFYQWLAFSEGGRAVKTDIVQRFSNEDTAPLPDQVESLLWARAHDEDNADEDDDDSTADIEEIDRPVLNFPEITGEETQRYQELEKLMDNREFQRPDIKHALDYLQMDAVEQLMTGMKQKFKFWQPPAVAGIAELLETEPLCYAILADAIGCECDCRHQQDLTDFE